MKSLNKKYLSQVGKYDFGGYQSLVESIVFEVESIKDRLEQSVKKRMGKYQGKRLKLLMYTVAFALAPTLTLLQLLIEESHFILIFIFGWLMISGISLLIMHFKSQDKIWFASKADHCAEIQAVQVALNYALIATEDYYSRAEVSDECGKVSKVMKGSDIDLIVSKLSKLEIDLQIFDEIVLKNQRFNCRPIILDSDAYLKNRDASQKYILGYLRTQVKEISRS